MKRRELILGILITVLAATLLACLPHLIESKTRSKATSTAFSSFIFPTCVLATMLLCGLGQMAQAAFAALPPLPRPMTRAAKLSVGKTVGVCLLYAVLMPRLGYVAATVPAMLLVFMIFGLASWLRGIAYSAVAAAAIYVIFAVFLGVPLPRGMLL